MDDVTSSEGRRFADAFAAAAGVAPLTDDEVDTVLGLAADAAHASERLAAPLVSWLGARAGLTPAEARVVVERLASR